MDNKSLSSLLYRRQFLLSPMPVNLEGEFKTVKINDRFYLNHHVDLPYTFAENGQSALYILGNLFDPGNRTSSNDDIARELLDYPFDDILPATDAFSGRYMIIYKDRDRLCLFHDFMSHFKVYWCSVDGECWCGSQPHVLAKLLGQKPSNDPGRKEFFDSERFRQSEYSDFLKYTIYEGVEHLQPNFYLDLTKRVTQRYWPVRTVSSRKSDDIVRESAMLLKGYLENASHRYKLMIPVTAGFDSRLLLAASRDVRDHCMYYIIKFPSLGPNSIDIRIPRRLLKTLGLDFKILELTGDVDEDFRKVYLENYNKPFIKRLPVIYNIFFRQFQDYMNVPANGAEAVLHRWWDGFDNNLKSRELMKLLALDDNPFVEKALGEWLSEARPVSEKYNTDLANLFYIEYRMANWATQYQVNKDIAQDEFFPFNSRRLFSVLVSADPYLRQVNSRIIFTRTMKYLWKDTLSQPFNPTFRNCSKIILEKTGLYNLIKRF